MTDFWLISVPQDRASSLSLEKLKHTVSKTNLASSFKFSIPELKVSICSVCVCLSMSLFFLVLWSSMVLCHHDICCLHILTVDLVSYVTKFQWDRAKYSTALPLKNLADIIAKQVSQVETEMRSRSAAYNHIKSSLKGFEVKTEGCLQTRMLTDIVKREDLVDSEYLTTLLVVVSKASYAQWENTYESLSEFVVPRSSRKVFEEKEGAIFTVTLFKKAVSDFTANAKKNSFDQNECQKQEMRRLSVDKKEQYGTFVRWLKVNFREVFVAWIHLKVLGVFVESVLRYGLPVSFQTLLLQPDKKHGKKLREQLSSLFGHLDPTAPVDLDMPGVSTVAPQDYYSYIYRYSNHLILK
uniref:V-type proton ATPase subunit C n=1 Tax=Esox lucius TaxID=8010 RepID=A0A3P9A5C8_ESOLU